MTVIWARQTKRLDERNNIYYILKKRWENICIVLLAKGEKNMKRRFFSRIVFKSAAAMGLLGRSALSAKTKQNKPNLLIVLVDQWRAQSIGLLKDDSVKTPNLDALARDGLLFTQAVCNSPVCTPARGSIMTGKYPQNNKIIHNKASIAKNEVSIGRCLKKAGFQTGYIGKWHMNGSFGQLVKPDRRVGWDYWFATNCKHINWKLNHYSGVDTFHEDEGRWVPEVETEVAIDFIKKNKEKPFALFLSYNPPHPGTSRNPKSKKDKGYFAPDKYMKMYEHIKKIDRPNYKKVPNKKAYMIEETYLNGYFGACTSLDEHFGQIVSFLKKEKLYDDTIIIFHSDHGEMLGSHQILGKKIWYEEAIRVPFIIRWGKNLKKGKEDALFSQIDILPTIMGLMNIKIPKGVDGIDHSQLMKGKKMKTRDYVFSSYWDKNAYNKDGTRKKRKSRKFFRLVRTKDFCLVAADIVKKGKNESGTTLYDLKKDPYQLKPVNVKKTTKYKKEAAFLRKLLQEHIDQTDDDFEGEI